MSNVKATRRIRLLPEVEDVYVFPHMGDGGLALGAAILAASQLREPIDIDLSRLDLGPDYDTSAMQAALRDAGLPTATSPNLQVARRNARRRPHCDGSGRMGMAARARPPQRPRASGPSSYGSPEPRAQAASVVQPSVEHARGERPTGATDWTGGRNTR